MKDRKFYSGNSIDQALMKASRDLGIPKENLQYKQIEKKHGFLKIRRNIVIEVDPRAQSAPAPDVETPERAREEPAREEPVRVEPVREEPVREEQVSMEPVPVEPVLAPEVASPPRQEAQPGPAAAQEPGAMVDLPQGLRPLTEKFPEAEGEVADAIRESLGMLLELADVEMESSVLQGSERFEVELWGADQERLLRDSGRPLLSLQHLLVRLVRGATGEAVYCRVDCDHFHEIREERLRDLAQRVASDVAGEHRSRLLESMAPDERRIVHMTLANDPSVETESQGNGYFKRVKILPA